MCNFTTEKREFGPNHDPVENTSILIKTRSKLLGSRSGYWADGSKADSLWFENDGVVNTISMYGPSTGINGSDPLAQYEKGDLLIPGQWYWQKISKQRNTLNWFFIRRQYRIKNICLSIRFNNTI